MQNPYLIALVFLSAFVFQSLPILLYRKSFLMKILPLAAMLFVSVSCIAEAAAPGYISPGMSFSHWQLIPLPMLLGDITGWILGYRFRHIIDTERELLAAQTDDRDKEDPSS